MHAKLCTKTRSQKKQTHANTSKILKDSITNTRAHTRTHTHYKLSLSFEFKVSKILEDSFQRYDSFILEYKGRRKKGVGREREEREE